MPLSGGQDSHSNGRPSKFPYTVHVRTHRIVKPLESYSKAGSRYCRRNHNAGQVYCHRGIARVPSGLRYELVGLVGR